MEAFLPQCVESILRTPSLAAVEIVVVNDGSKDRTSRIAHEYADRFSDTVRVIDKPNGNYGSTINAALKEVRGEYVKILDADDSFDGSRVAEFLAFLRKMQGVDMVVTPFVEIIGRKSRRVEYNIYGRKLYKYGKQYNIESVFDDGAIRFFMMHGVCYRTELLRSMGYRQTEGISYTDQEWVFYPLFKVQTVAFADIPLYRYNLSREGQTMDAKVQMRSLAQLVAVTEASNTLGTCPDLRPIIERAHSVGAVVMVDGCQGIVHGGGHVAERGYDFYAFSGHKLYGPTGIGVLYGRRELLEAMPPYMGGGDMVDKVTFAKTTYAPLPLKYEAGTSNFIGAVALAEAIRYVEGVGMAAIEEHERILLRAMTDRLSAVEGLRIYGTTEGKCPIVSFTVEGTHPYDVGMILDKMGVAIRTGHHCAEPVMTHYGITGMSRASIGMYNTLEEVDVLGRAVERAVIMLK